MGLPLKIRGKRRYPSKGYFPRGRVTPYKDNGVTLPEGKVTQSFTKLQRETFLFPSKKDPKT